MDKARVIAEIKRTAEANGGTPLGQRRFAEETAITIATWRGKYWATWSDALREAGFAPNTPREAFTREELTLALIAVTRRLKRYPTFAETRIEKQSNPAFPTEVIFARRLGDAAARVAAVRTYATEHSEHSDVLPYLPVVEELTTRSDDGDADDKGDGAVYMVKHGKHYKIGHTFDVPRRHRQIALELPEKLEPVHTIRTDDPAGIEAYWHRRFAAKRTNPDGEWFALTKEDLRAFKRRRFM